MISANKHWIYQQIILQLLTLAARLALPITLGYFIDWFSDPFSETIPKLLNPEADGYIWAALFSLMSFAYGLTMSPNFHLQMVQGIGYF